MTIDADIPFEANAADILEQHQPIIDDGDSALPEEIPLADANPADALDQHLTVPIDDDEWPATPTN